MNSNFKTFHQKLLTRKKSAQSDFFKKHKKAALFLLKKGLPAGKIREHSAKLLAGASLATTLILSPPTEIPQTLPTKKIQKNQKFVLTAMPVSGLLSKKLKELIGDHPIGHLPKEAEGLVCQAIEGILGIKVCGELENNRLNFSLGFIGYEQHLIRFPGDTLEQHDDELVAGIAPGFGAWGYFANTKEELTPEQVLMEKYYVAVQTLYLPEWVTDTEKIYNWYKYRKVIVVNPENGQACVGVVGDAGPAQWTGKQFGGSPELMKAVDLHLEWRTGKVLLLFVDDPEDKVPLGPIEYNIKEEEVGLV